MYLHHILRIYCSKSVVIHNVAGDYSVSCCKTEVENKHFTLEQNAI